MGVRLMTLRESLAKIGEPQHGEFTAIPHGFGSFPKSGSILTAMHGMNSPKIEQWGIEYEDNINNETWTEECQGVTTDGSFWYFSSNNDRYRAIHKIGLNWKYHGNFRYPYTDIVAGKNEVHLGDPDFYNGNIYVPIESTKEARICVLNTNLEMIALPTLGGEEEPPQKKKMPWLAINPWNGLLYSSIFGDEGAEPVTTLYAYDLKNFLHDKKNDIILKDKSLYKVQGGCFSNNGHVFLASDDTHSIHAYSSLNGHYYGSCFVPSDWTDGEELEGIAFSKISPEGHKDTYIHAIVLDMDNPYFGSPGNPTDRNPDDVYFKHFHVPDPDVL